MFKVLQHGARVLLSDSHERSSILARIIRGSFWSLVGTVGVRALSLTLSIIVARLLGKATFGEVGIIQSTVGTFQTFAGFSLGLLATKHVAQFRRNHPERAGLIIALSDSAALISGLIMTVVLLISSPWIAHRMLANGPIGSLLQISSVLLLFGAINGAQTGTLAGFEAFASLARANILGALLSFPISVAGVWYFGIRGFLWGLIINQGALCLLFHFQLRKEFRKHGIYPQFRGCFAERSLLWTFSLPAVLSSSMVAPAQWICNVLLVNTHGGYAEMGIFNACNQWRNVLMFVPLLLLQAGLPVMSSQSGGVDSLQKGFRVTNMLVIVCGLPIATILMFLAVPLMHAYGKDFSSGSLVFIGLTLVSMMQFVSAGLGPAIESSGRMWLALTVNLIWAVTYISIVVLTVKGLGAVALAFGCVAAYVVHNMAEFIAMRRFLPSDSMTRALLATALTGLITAAAIFIPGWLRPLFALPAALAVLGATLLIEPEFLSELRRLRAQAAAAQ